MHSLRLLITSFGALIFIGAFFSVPPTTHAATIIQAPLYIGLTNGLVGNWSFDGASVSGTDPVKVNDLSGNNNEGSASGANIPKLTTGRVGQAMEFEGGDDYVTMGDASALSPRTGPLSVSVWFKTSAQTSRDFLVGKIASTGSGCGDDTGIAGEPNKGTRSFIAYLRALLINR